MTYYEVRSVEADPAMAFQAACNACQRIGMTPSAIHVRARVAIYSIGPHFKRGSIGEFITVRVWTANDTTRVGMEGTPMFGPWSRATVDALLDRAVEEFDAVMAAPTARMRDIKAPPRAARPFGQLPRALAVGELVAALVLWLLVVGGALGVFATVMAAVNALLVFVPQRWAWWRAAAFGTALLNIPTGILGMVAGRMALAQALWPKGARARSGPEPGTVPVVPAPQHDDGEL